MSKGEVSRYHIGGQRGSAGIGFRRFVHDFKDTLRAGNGVENRGVLVGDFTQRTGKLLGKLNKEKYRCDTEASVYREDHAGNDDEKITDVPDDVHKRSHDAAENLRFDPRFLQFSTSLGKLLFGFFLSGECENGPIAHDAFLYLGVQFSKQPLLRQKISSDPFCQK